MDSIMLRRINTQNGVVYYRSDILNDVQVPHAFSTRVGGISPKPFDSLNLGNPSGCDVLDQDARIDRNYQILQDAIACADRSRCWAHQVHGAEVLLVRSGETFENGQKADALMTSDASRVLAIRCADCVPILVASDDGRHVAAIHAGWRGVIAGVLPKAIVLLQSATNRPLLVAIGPSISFDAFEVGPEVLEEFSCAFGHSDSILRRRSDGKGHVDLREALRVQVMRDCDIESDRIEISDRCTVRDSDEFFSHRRDNGITGRMAAIIGARNP
jgi:polyphenol oxidase